MSYYQLNVESLIIWTKKKYFKKETGSGARSLKTQQQQQKGKLQNPKKSWLRELGPKASCDCFPFFWR